MRSQAMCLLAQHIIRYLLIICTAGVAPCWPMRLEVNRLAHGQDILRLQGLVEGVQSMNQRKGVNSVRSLLQSSSKDADAIQKALEQALFNDVATFGRRHHRPIIPRILHQTVADLSRVPCAAAKWMKTWRKVGGADLKHVVHDDASIRALIETQYPSLLRLFDHLTPVEKSDVWRVLVLHHHGGMYADIDVSLHKPFRYWRQTYPAVFGAYPHVLLGIEGLGPLGANKCCGIRNPLQVSNWFLAAAPGHSFMLSYAAHMVARAAADAFEILDNVLHNRTQLGDELIKAVHAGIVPRTGPVLLSEAVAAYLQRWSAGSPLSVADALLLGSKGSGVVLNGIGILPIDAVGAGQGHSGAGPTNASSVLVVHHFQGSWKTPTAPKPAQKEDMCTWENH